MKKRISLAIILSILLLLFTSCGVFPGNKATPRSATYYEFFGTVSSVQSFGEDTDENFAAVTDKVKALLSEYHSLFDIYHEYSGINNLKTVNDKAGIEPVEVDERIIDLLQLGVEMYELTNGEVNIMMGSTLELWHDARDGNGDGTHTLPNDDALMMSYAYADVSLLEIDEEAGTVYVSDANASIDVGSIAKGFTTDRIAEALTSDASLSTEGYALNIGGNIRIIGSKAGDPFTVGITNPDKSSEEPYVALISVTDTSVVTSGDYERFFTVDGKNYHHIIDKDTLYPAEYFHSVTVVTENGALADALSTALFCMHINAGYALVEGMSGVEAMWIGTNGTTVKSTGFPEAEK